MAQPVFVAFTPLLGGASIDVDATDQIADLSPVPTAELNGAANGTYITFVSGRTVAVQGTVAATATALGISGSGFAGMARVSTAGAFLTKTPFFTGWVAARTGAGVYTLTSPNNIAAGSIGIEVTSETAALYCTATLTGAAPGVITVRTFDAAATPTDALFDILVMNGLS